MSKYSKKLGFTLLEVVIAIFVLTVAILGTMILIYNTLLASSITSNRLIAAYLAQEGIEIVRNIRDTNWLEGDDWKNGLGNGDWQADYDDLSLTSYNPGNVLYIDANGFYNYFSGSPTKFQRKITIGSGPVSDSLEVTVEVNWQERGKPYSFTVKERLYKWY